ncbi:MAG: hypothetical protein WDW38_007004 [Sanguina aurantia]
MLPLAMQALVKLQDKRVAVEKVVMHYGEAPSGIKEVFELCRGFERAYVNLVNDSPVASKIKDCFSGDAGLAGMVKKLPHDKVFKIENVKSVSRVADGYQPSLVSPENGMRKLASDALDQVVEPVNKCVQQVYTHLINSAREAAEKAGHFTEAALVGTSMPMYVPEFKNVVMPAVTAAMDEWRIEAQKVSLMLVDMERSYLTAGFFRQTQHNRYNKIKQQETMRANMAGEGAGPGREASPAPSSAANAAPSVVDDGSSDDEAPASGKQASQSKKSGGTFVQGTDPDDFVAAFFDKYSSSDSARSSLPDGWRWQKRFFVFSMSQRVLYYFKSVDEVHKPSGCRGQVAVSDCVIDDLDEKGSPRGAPPAKGQDPGDKSQLMIRIRGRNSNAIIKDHTALVLRAESASQKAEWLMRLRKGAEPAGPRASRALDRDGRPLPPGSSASEGADPVAAEDENNLDWAKQIEPVLDNHLGEGARAFRADAVRDNDGRLLLAPPQVLNPLRVVERQRRLNADPFQVRMDALLEQHGLDMSVYMQMVCDTVIITVPKAVVHCMIRKSEKNVLERLFTVIHHMTDAQMKVLLKEDDDVVAKRRAGRKALEDVKTAIFKVGAPSVGLDEATSRITEQHLLGAQRGAGVSALLCPAQQPWSGSEGQGAAPLGDVVVRAGRSIGGVLSTGGGQDKGQSGTGVGQTRMPARDLVHSCFGVTTAGPTPAAALLPALSGPRAVLHAAAAARHSTAQGWCGEHRSLHPLKMQLHRTAPGVTAAAEWHLLLS